MLTLEDCVSLCGLTEDEILAIAEHERIPEMAAAELGNYLCYSVGGEMCIKAMIRDDIAHARDCGARERELVLKQLLRDFVLRHPRCDERHQEQLGWRDRRIAGGS